MQNRRAHPRYETSLAVEIYTGTDIIHAQVTNLSQGGIGISMDTPLPANGMVGLSMFLVEEGIEDERTDPINVQGQVCWCNPGDEEGYQAGVRFAPLQVIDLQRLQHFLQRLRA